MSNYKQGSFINKKKYLYKSSFFDEMSDENLRQRIGPNDHEKKRELDKEIREEIQRVHFELLKQSSFTKNDERKINEFIDDYIKKKRYFFMDPEDRKTFINDIINDIFGLGIVEALQTDPTVTEIWVVGKKRVWYERNGKRYLSNLQFKDEQSIRNLISKILAPINRSVDEMNPIVDARLKDGSRVAITIPPVALNGPEINIRKFKESKFTLDNYVNIGSCSRAMQKFLSTSVKAGLNILICGGTGSGKTTLLNALSNEIDATNGNERIITIEDSAELKIYQDFVSGWETKNKNSEGVGGVNPSQLVKHALRNSPDRIILGEIRDAVAFDVLQASNTGHDGTMSTIHANDCKGAVKRFGDLVSGEGTLTSRDAQMSFCETFDLIVSVQKIVANDPNEPAIRAITQITYIAGFGAIGMEKCGIKTKDKKIEERAYLQDLFSYDIKTGKFSSSGFVPSELINKAEKKNFPYDMSIFVKTENKQ